MNTESIKEDKNFYYIKGNDFGILEDNKIGLKIGDVFTVKILNYNYINRSIICSYLSLSTFLPLTLVVLIHPDYNH